MTDKVMALWAELDRLAAALPTPEERAGATGQNRKLMLEYLRAFEAVPMPAAIQPSQNGHKPGQPTKA